MLDRPFAGSKFFIYYVPIEKARTKVNVGGLYVYDNNGRGKAKVGCHSFSSSDF